MVTRPEENMNSGMRSYIDISSFDDKPRSRRRSKAPSRLWSKQPVPTRPLRSTPPPLERARSSDWNISYLLIKGSAFVCAVYIKSRDGHGLYVEIRRTDVFVLLYRHASWNERTERIIRCLFWTRRTRLFFVLSLSLSRFTVTVLYAFNRVHSRESLKTIPKFSIRSDSVRNESSHAWHFRVERYFVGTRFNRSGQFIFHSN